MRMRTPTPLPLTPLSPHPPSPIMIYASPVEWVVISSVVIHVTLFSICSVIGPFYQRCHMVTGVVAFVLRVVTTALQQARNTKIRQFKTFNKYCYSNITP
jgi:hypothetical protein